MAKIIVSGCLMGFECRYKGDSRVCDEIVALSKDNTLIFICPEQMGGLATPRDPAEQVGDRVITNHGADVTAQYEKGAQAALKLALMNKADFAILKSRSPSCGSGVIYDGTYSGTLTSGDGVCARLFKQHGIPVYTEEELDKLPL